LPFPERHHRRASRRGSSTAIPNGGIISDCNAFSNLDATGTALDPTFQNQIIKGNNVFPFSFTKQPFQARLSISLPIFDGFTGTCRWLRRGRRKTT
jgi:hypothetical protein